MLGTIKVGHAGDERALTGCTVFLPPEGSTAACEVRGGAPGTRETELLRPTFTVQCPHAVLMSGGSAFGLAAATGVVDYLEEQGVGFPTPGGLVPIVSAAVIFDLDIGDGATRPDAEMGRRACAAASLDEEREGSVGVGLGASVGNVYGRSRSVRGGFGMYRFHAAGFKIEIAGVVNSYGDVVDDSGVILGGVRDENDRFVGAEKAICESTGLAGGTMQNTTLVLVATNATLTCAQGARLALQGHNGIARAVRPSHSRYDGDTVFVISTNEVEAPIDAVEALAAMGTAQALRSGVMRAGSGGGVPSAGELSAEGR